MKRLLHPIRAIREPFGTAGLIVACVALIAALGGTALAAAKLNGTQKKEVEKIAKKFAGKPGAAGAQGPAGAAGAKGDAGAAGGSGAAGEKGEKGDKGEKGEKGNTGEAGMCSQAKPECKLAAGATLTGVWGTQGVGSSLVQISFPVEVSPAPTGLYESDILGFHIGAVLKDGTYEFYGPHPTPEELEEVEEDEAAFKAACPGTVDAPAATSGFLCIYPGKKEGNVTEVTTNSGRAEAVNPFGVVVPLAPEAAGSTLRGSWAVTG